MLTPSSVSTVRVSRPTISWADSIRVISTVAVLVCIINSTLVIYGQPQPCPPFRQSRERLARWRRAGLRGNPRVQADVQNLPAAFAAMRKTWLGLVGLEEAIRHNATRCLSEGNRDTDQADPGSELSQAVPPTGALARHPVAAPKSMY